MVLAPCHHIHCYNGGYCDDDGKGKDGCVCVNGWQGADCRASKVSSLFNSYVVSSISIGSCGPHGPVCHNGGTCLPDAHGGYTCQCESPWFGPTCEKRMFSTLFILLSEKKYTSL